MRKSLKNSRQKEIEASTKALLKRWIMEKLGMNTTKEPMNEGSSQQPNSEADSVVSIKAQPIIAEQEPKRDLGPEYEWRVVSSIWRCSRTSFRSFPKLPLYRISAMREASRIGATGLT